ncbi:MAG: diguanylate cyclase [Clostridia bacterium]
MDIRYNYPITENDFKQMSNDYELFRYGAIISDDIFFKIDIVNSTVMFLGNKLKFFKNRQVIPNYIDLVNKINIIHPDDREIFDNAIANLQHGIGSSLKFRLVYPDKSSLWFHAQYTIVMDDNGAGVVAMGKINNIQETQDLADRASLDLLTSCLNKITFETYSKKFFAESLHSSSDQHVCLIIDIDNFKAINDNLGHFFGDIVLKEIATKLKRIFRETDYIGRIGGDEFAVIMKNVENGKVILAKIQAVLDDLKNTYKSGSSNYQISASVGVALFPQHGDNYDDIYKNADAALYNSKYKGKNAYTIYDETIKKGTMANSTPFDAATRALSYYFDQEIAMDTFNLLFEDDNYESSVNTVLRHIGNNFNVDRCYIFELQDNKTDIYDNTYEWCRDGIEPQIDFLKDIEVDTFGELFDGANDEGVYYCNDLSIMKNNITHETLAMQGIKSLLITNVKKNDVVSYAIGFDDCTSARIWTPREISTLMYSSKIISQFLSYKRALVVAENKFVQNLKVLDSLNFYAYIVDEENHSLKYLNDVTKKLVPEAKIGKKCYEVLRGYKSECADCPLKVLRENPQNSKVKMIIHNDKLNLDVLVTASSLISYDGRKSVFVSSTDIKEMINLVPKEKQNFKDFIVLE